MLVELLQQCRGRHLINWQYPLTFAKKIIRLYPGGDGMEAILDKFGRIIIPKELRDALGVGPGSAFHIEEINQEIHLKPVEGTPHLKNKNGWLVFTGEPQADITGVIDQFRMERFKQNSGMKK
jgi:AbrB family looped-hinge helix DNA binding protein